MKKIKASVKKNPYPSYAFITELMLSKAEKWKHRGNMEFKFHYLMMNSEYGYANQNYIKEIYENIDDAELTKKNGDNMDT